MDADIVLSGTVQYVGDPDDRPSQLNRMRNKAQVSGTVTTAASVGMGMADSLSLISRGAGLLTSAVTEAMEPNEIQGVVLFHIRQGDQMWDVDLEQTVEAQKDVASKKLAAEMADSLLSQLGG